MAENITAAQTNAGSVTENIHDPTTDWRSSNHFLKQRFEFIFNNKLFCDINFIVGEDQKQKIPASKFVLSAGSLVFETMFSGQWQESSVVEIPDIEPAIFSELLRFLYSDEALVNDDTVFGLLYAAKKYAVFGLENRCAEFLSKNICSSNVFPFLVQARFFNLPKLVDSCLQNIDEDTVSAFNSDGFCGIDNDTLCVVLARDTLRINEIDLFEAVIRWSKAECQRQKLAENSENQKSVLQGALALIRYPVMSAEEFGNIVADSNLLSLEEQLSVSLYFIKNPRPSITFNTSPRVGDHLILKRFKGVESGWQCNGSSNTIRFGFNKLSPDPHLLGVGLFGAVSGQAEYLVNLSVFCRTLTGDTPLYEQSKTHIATGKTFRIYFNQPVKLNTDYYYTIKLSMKGPESFHGVEGFENFSQTDPNGRKVNCEMIKDGTTSGWITKGQIPEILIKL